MRIVSIRLRNFRCFSTLDLDIESPVVLIHGPNGSGKTSVLEALHYACYLRSFKTHLPKELVRTATEGFGISINLAAQTFDTLQVQFANKKRTIKLNEQGIGSYKELYDAYRVVTITEDDLRMIQGSPGLRRSFLDTMVQLLDPSHAALVKNYKAILENRNALLMQAKFKGHIDQESYLLWTDQLLQASRLIQEARTKAVGRLEKEAQALIREIFVVHDEEPLKITYSYARPYSDIELGSAQELIDRYPTMMNNEIRQKRTLFGAHLDDCTITYLGQACRTYSSRGQQKLVLFLLKLAQLQVIKGLDPAGGSAILLVDDFMTDFDNEKASALIPMMTKLSSQVILTSPIEEMIKNKLPKEATQSINLGRSVTDKAPFIIQGVNV